MAMKDQEQRNKEAWRKRWHRAQMAHILALVHDNPLGESDARQRKAVLLATKPVGVKLPRPLRIGI